MIRVCVSQVVPHLIGHVGDDGAHVALVLGFAALVTSLAALFQPLGNLIGGDVLLFSLLALVFFGEEVL